MSSNQIQQKALLVIFLLAFYAPLAQSSPWQVTQFEVVEEDPTNDVVDDLYDAVAGAASIPLTPDLKMVIEQYITAVAVKYQEWGLPAPRLPVVIRDDGSSAYRVNYYDSNQGFAVYGPLCNDAENSSIRLNAEKLTVNGRITSKAYVDIAHELFHSVDANSKLARGQCSRGLDLGKWISEGIPEAIGQDMAWEFIGHTKRGMAAVNQQQRWGMRNYSVALPVVATGSTRGTERLNVYQTSSFWRYLAELWYLRKNLQLTQEKPGPEKPTNFDHGQTETNYSYISKLFSTDISGQGPMAEIRWLDKYLEKDFSKHLNQIYIDFVAVLAQYGRYRVAGVLALSKREAAWRNHVFATPNATQACKPLTIDLSNDNVMVAVTLNKLATQCVELDVGHTGTALLWTYQIVAENDTLLKQVQLAMAGGQQVVTSAAMAQVPGNTQSVTSWNIALEPDQKQYLLIANVAREPWLTKPQTVQLYITLMGHKNNVSPSQEGSGTSPNPPPKPKPGPAGADTAKQQREAELGFQSLGAGTADWEFMDATEFCTAQVRAKGDCTTDTKITLYAGVSSNMFIGQVSPDASGSIINQLMSSVGSLRGDVTHNAAFMQGNDGTVISMTLPDVDYGFSGSVSGIDIKISGKHESAGMHSWSPVVVSPGAPCIWGTPTGKVTIEEFTPFIMRGSFSGAMISAELLSEHRGPCPIKPILQQAAGKFVIAAPWVYDHRVNDDMSWVLEDNGFTNGDMPEDNSDAATSASGISPGLGQDFTQYSKRVSDYGPEDCECTCEEYNKGLKVTQQLMFEGKTNPDDESMRLTSCVSYCTADVMKMGCEINLQ